MEKRIKNRITPDILSEIAARYGVEPTEGEGRILRHGGYFQATALRCARGRYAWETGWSDALFASYDFKRIQERLP